MILTLIIWLTFMSGFHRDSNTAIAANEPDPIVVYGSLLDDPWGWRQYKDGPNLSTPPIIKAAPTYPW